MRDSGLRLADVVFSRACARVLVFVLAVVLGCSQTRAQPRLDCSESCVVGDEFRAIVQTSRTTKVTLFKTAQQTDYKRWLVIVDLTRPGPIQGRSRVIGPLWELPKAVSAIQQNKDASFSKPEVDAKKGAPYITFDDTGNLVRLSFAPGYKSATKEVLELKPGAVAWKDGGPYTPVPNIESWVEKKKIETLGCKYRLQYVSGQAAVHEFFTGTRMKEGWLEKAYVDLQQTRDLVSSRVFLTTDLGYLVVDPQGKAVLDRMDLYSFTIKGGQYSRDDYWVYWARSSPEPTVVRKQVKVGPDGKREYDTFYAEAITINGQLCMVEQSATGLKIVKIGRGRQVSEIAIADIDQWCPRVVKHLEKEEKLILMALRPVTGAHNAGTTMVVGTWDYRNKILTRAEVPLDDLFKQSGEHFVPQKGEPVKK